MEGESLKILLVEDNYDHAELVIRNMEDSRIANSITHVEDGEEALDYVFGRARYADRAQYPTPHLILLDLRLPKVDGLDVLKEIKSNEATRNIPVVVLTTSDAERDLAKAYEYRANSYVTKPVDFEDFSKMLQDMGFYWLIWNKRPR